MTRDRGLQGALQSWLHEDRHEDATRILHTVLDGVGATPQHRPRWSVEGILSMNKFVVFGLGAAAVVVVLFIGAQFRGTPTPGGPNPTQSAAPSEAPASVEPSEAPASVEPSSSGDGFLPVGPHVLNPVHPVTMTISEPGWVAEPDVASVTKELGGDDRVTVVAVSPDFTFVPRNICHWRMDDDVNPTRFPDTVDELMAWLAEQTWDTPDGLVTREFGTPEDITIDGYPGQRIHDLVPAYPGSDPSGCDEQRFCSLADRDGYRCLLSHLEPGALDTLWIVDAPGRGHLRVIASSGRPNTGLRHETNLMVESANFHAE